MRILVDYNMEGQAGLIWDTLLKKDGVELPTVHVRVFKKDHLVL